MTFSLRRILISSLGVWLALAVCVLTLLYLGESNIIDKKLNFGIDLVGGTYITLGVKTNEAVVNELQSLMQASIIGLKHDERIEVTSSKADKEKLYFELSFANQADALKAQSYIEKEYQDGPSRNSKDLKFSLSGDVLTIKFSDKKDEAIRKAAVVGNEEVLRTRLNATGVEEVPVYSRGKDRIVIELPNVHDPIKAKKMIGTPAMLEFRLIEAGPKATREELLDEFDGEIPEGMEVLEGRDHNERAYFLVPDYSEVTGRYLLKAAARPQHDQMGNPQMAVTFKFNNEGGDRFHELTSQNIGRLLGTVLDKRVVSHATIQSSIRREGQITGQFSQEEGKELAAMLRSGAFSAPVTFEEERHIGPGLGADSIKRGLLSCLVGLALVFMFSLFYYKLSGLFAFCALVYNLILVLFFLWLFGGTLTLPGIAGLVLTVGMAIDSSILIYERIKELLAQGLPIPQAVRQGFYGAMRVILDANITTFIVGAVLYWFGSGPIKGFAVTLMIGIITTLITGLFFLRSIFELWISKNVQKLSI